MAAVGAAGAAVAVAAAVAAVAAAGGETGNGRMNMSNRPFRALSFALVGLALLATLPDVARAQGTYLDEYAAEASPPAFADQNAAIAALKAALAAGDFDATAKLLGLDPARVKSFEGIQETFSDMREGAAQRVILEEDGDRAIISLGRDLWPLPFPLAKSADGKWAFDTTAGFEEIINRRVGENELEAIATAQAYVEAQLAYAAEDRDGDGVLEYAQQLVSSEGKTNGLYWPLEQGDGDSPAGDFIDQAAFSRAKSGDGYFGYHFRVLRGQGDNVAGDRHDYLINGNMIAGFGLIAWPAEYAETGVSTFVVNQAGIVYEKDLGPKTSELVAQMRRFNPDKSWEIAK
jgi:hypothetical protein